MLHTQITRVIKHKVVFIRKLRAHAFLFFLPDTLFGSWTQQNMSRTLHLQQNSLGFGYRLAFWSDVHTQRYIGAVDVEIT